MTEVIMPKMGDGMEEGTLLEWLKKDGETVKSGEVIGTIQTDKATLELESPGSGALTGFLLQAGETVPVGRPIAVILKAGESLPAGWGSGSAAATTTAVAETPVEAAPVAAAVAAAMPAAVETTGRIKASPLAKRIAAEAGVSLTSVVGTGPGGRIVEKDVRAAIASGGTKLPSLAPVAPAVVAATAEDQVVKLNRLRQITAQRTTASKQQVPHFYVRVEVDLEKIHAIREAFKEEEGGKISVNDFVIRACALALRDMPVVNSTYQGDHLLQYGAVNIGMAVALEDGLTVPVMKNADQMTLRQISAASRSLAGKARDNKLGPDELIGSTFSISNMGMLDVDDFGAIINAPNAAIVAIGTAKRVAVVTEDDEFEARWKMNMTGSFDHRVVDGAVGARFMNKVREYLESPTRLLS
ncbi:MAG: 2-oxo acid dehydrogenase subunit E2 [Armatimonadetes bacterium]|nr:2-oxo acid dehydrogenase subunit E2 [Armatimonadota bacterium]